jgi:hypothetical protein
MGVSDAGKKDGKDYHNRKLETSLILAIIYLAKQAGLNFGAKDNFQNEPRTLAGDTVDKPNHYEQA